MLGITACDIPNLFRLDGSTGDDGTDAIPASRSDKRPDTSSLRKNDRDALVPARVVDFDLSAWPPADRCGVSSFSCAVGMYVLWRWLRSLDCLTG